MGYTRGRKRGRLFSYVKIIHAEIKQYVGIVSHVLENLQGIQISFEEGGLQQRH